LDQSAPLGHQDPASDRTHLARTGVRPADHDAEVNLRRV
jgi:hypothetical protein